MKIPKLTTILILLCLLSVTVACHRKHPKSDATMNLVPVATLYQQGLDAMKDKKPVRARRYFDQIMLREDSGDYKDRASIAIADSFIEEGTMEAYAEAISRYRTFLTFHPTHPKAAYCQYMIGHAYFKEANSPDRDTTPATHAREAFNALLENYPSSSYVKEANEELREIDDVLAAHEIKVGDWYMKDGHYKGAIARYRYALKKYPNYWNEPLLQYRLAEALREDGQTKEAIVYYNALAKSVPGTKLANKATDRLDAINRKERIRLKKKEKVLEGPLVKQQKDENKHWWQFWKWFH